MADDSERGRSPRARICIDFGTALSKACLCLDPAISLDVGVRPIPLGVVSGADHPLLTPSVLFVDSGRIFFGPAAFALARRGTDLNRDPLLSFKSVLSAKDIDEALAAKLPPSMDPTATFRQRDALVLYLAHLDQLIREALRHVPNLPPDIADARRRYTSPIWEAGGKVDRTFAAIFNEGAAVSAKLGRLLLAPEGISIAQCKDALDKATAAAATNLDTGVFEPHAAAAAALAYTNAPIRFVMVFDMGAGTTDIAAFDFDESVEPPTLNEIKAARHCSTLAGDELDRILVDLLMQKRGATNNREDDIRFKRLLRLHARDLKRTLFTEGRCALKEKWKTTTVRLQDLTEDPQFRTYVSALGEAVGGSLSAVAAQARAAGANMIDVVLAGGGSHLDFVSEIVRSVGAAAAPGMNLRVGALSPANALYSGVDQYFVAVFPQIAMSVGGSLVELVDAPAH